MDLTLGINLELKKLKHRYFFITWFVLTTVPIIFELYNIRNLGFSTRYLFKTSSDYYFYVESANVELFSLFLPIMASILISKLIDSEHKENTWKLLLTSNQSFISLWFSKFLIVYFLMDLSCFLAYFTTTLFVFLKTGAAIPYLTLFLTFLGVCGANLITLTIAQIIATVYKNQLIVNIEGIIGGFVGLISALLPRSFSYIIPWGYYTLNVLSGNRPIGTDLNGLTNWEVYNIEPNFLVIYLVSILFLLLNIIVAKLLSKKEI